MTEFIPPATRYVDLPSPFRMKRGGELHGARMAYETWGRLDASGGNALLILTGLSPDAHAASNAANPAPGWWEAMVGPGKAIDTDRWFVVCANSLGSCKGSTGPASINPATGAPYRLDFPELSIEDAPTPPSTCCRRWASNTSPALSATRWAAWRRLPPAAASRDRPRARQHLRRRARAAVLDRDPLAATRGDPAGPGLERRQLRRRTLSRVGHAHGAQARVITYRSALEWDGRFGRVRLDSDRRDDEDPFGLEFEVESYLEAHARRFVRKFDPNCYLYLSRSMDWFDLAEYCDAPCGDRDGDVMQALAKIRADKALAIGVTTDILFPLQQQEQVAEGLRAGGADATFLPLQSPQGHDAFLVDFARFDPAVRDFLAGL